MIASASRNLFSMTTILPRSICWTSPESNSPTLPENSSRMRVRSPSRTRWMMRCFAAWTAVRPNCSNGTSSSNTSPGWKSASSKRASSRVIWVPGSSTASTTVFSTTIRIDPFISSIPISARTLGPYRFTRAACKPSLSRSMSSPRSSCLVLVSSRIAETTSVALAIRNRFSVVGCCSPVGGKPGVAYRRERQRPLCPTLKLQHHGGLVGHRDDAGPHPAQAFQPGSDRPAHEAHPVALPLERPLQPGARDLEEVAGPQGSSLVQPGLQGPARPGAIGDGHRPRRVTGRPFDAHLDQRPLRGAADAEVGQLQPQRVELGAERFLEAFGEHAKKSAGLTSPAAKRNVDGAPAMSSERASQVRDLPAVTTARRAV